MKFPVKFIISLLILIIGIFGSVICAVPHYSGAERVVVKYIESAKDNNAEKMIKCTIASEASGALGQLGMDGIFNQGSGYVGSDLLIKNILNLPSDANEIKSVKILGCSKSALQEGLTSAGYNVGALIKTVYVDAQGETQEIVSEEAFTVVNIGSGYKIASFN